jgi:hypothetical protein
MYCFIVTDDRGAVATDWVALTAGIIVLGMVVAFTVLGRSDQLVQNTFDALDAQLASTTVDLATVGGRIDIND